MVRPRRCRWVRHEPDVNYFKPQGVPLQSKEKVSLELDEFEALRLMDHEELDQNTAATHMKVSQPTFCRIYKSARAKVALALVEGLAIKIHGGAYKMPNKDRTGPSGSGPMTGRGRGPCSHGAGYRCGAGYRRGAGYGPNMGFGRQDPISKEEERKALEEEKKIIEQRLQELNN